MRREGEHRVNGEWRGGVGADEGWAGEVGRAVNRVSAITEELQEREG